MPSDMKRLRTTLTSLTLLLAACGGKVEVDSSSAGGSTGSTLGAGGAGGACVGDVELVVDNGAPRHLTSRCSGGWNPQMWPRPIGYLIEGGVVPPVDGGVALGGARLEIFGCVSAAPQSEGVELLAYDVTGPGSYTVGLVRYTDAAGLAWGIMSDPFVLDLAKLGAVGDSIEGTVKATVSQGGKATRDVAGSFHVCRAPDELVP
jgi:hypothetical protein